MKNLWLVSGLIAWVLVTFVVVAWGVLVSGPAISGWYADLHKPALTPPPGAFALIWLVMYILMAIAAWIVWRKYNFAIAGTPLTAYLTQLLLNAFWLMVFFEGHAILTAFWVMVLIWLVSVMLTLQFWQQSRLAARLMLPYLVWITFVAAVNYDLWLLNKTPINWDWLFHLVH